MHALQLSVADNWQFKEGGSMIPDWSERSAVDAAYPSRHWTVVEQSYCVWCEEPLSQDEVECNGSYCDKCLGKEGGE